MENDNIQEKVNDDLHTDNEQAIKNESEVVTENFAPAETICENSHEEFLEEVKGDFENADFSTEERNYSKRTFNRVQKLRVDGVAYGIIIAPLKNDLTKPEKTRKSMSVLGVMSIIIMGLVLALMAWLGSIFLPPLLGASSDLMGLSNATVSVFTLGLSDLLTGGVTVFVVFLIVAMLMLFLLIISFVYQFVRGCFVLAKCSIEEMAVGFEVTELITKTICVLVLSLLLGGFSVFAMIQDYAIGFLILFIVGISLIAYSLGLLICILKERKKAKKIFDEFPEDVQNNFRDHVRNVGLVKSRKKRINKNAVGSTANINYWNFY